MKYVTTEVKCENIVLWYFYNKWIVQKKEIFAKKWCNKKVKT